MMGFFCSPRFIVRANGPTKCGRYLLRSSLAAALPAEWRVLARRGWAGEKSGLFEHPAGGGAVARHMRTIKVLACQNCFFAIL
jgi:hypothetical protein